MSLIKSNTSYFDSVTTSRRSKINDIIDKKYKSCGCILISELNIIDNIIQDNYIQLCKTHYHSLNINKLYYELNKKTNNFILKEKSDKESRVIENKKENFDNLPIIQDSNAILYNSKSYENLQAIIFKCITNFKHTDLLELKKNNLKLDHYTNPSNSETLLNFGKYKNKTYDYVYYNDKLYCYNLAFWNKKDFKNQKILKFIEYIKYKIILESLHF